MTLLSEEVVGSNLPSTIFKGVFELKKQGHTILGIAQIVEAHSDPCAQEEAQLGSQGHNYPL